MVFSKIEKINMILTYLYAGETLYYKGRYIS